MSGGPTTDAIEFTQAIAPCRAPVHQRIVTNPASARGKRCRGGTRRDASCQPAVVHIANNVPIEASNKSESTADAPCSLGGTSAVMAPRMAGLMKKPVIVITNTMNIILNTRQTAADPRHAGAGQSMLAPRKEVGGSARGGDRESVWPTYHASVQAANSSMAAMCVAKPTNTVLRSPSCETHDSGEKAATKQPSTTVGGPCAQAASGAAGRFARSQLRTRDRTRGERHATTAMEANGRTYRRCRRRTAGRWTLCPRSGSGGPCT